MKITRNIGTIQSPVKAKIKRKPLDKIAVEKYISKGGDIGKKTAFLDELSASTRALKSNIKSLEPFKPVFKATLKQAGHNVPKEFPSLVEKFHNEIVLKSNKTPFAKYSETLKPCDLSTTPKDNLDTASNAVIAGIVSFINGVKDKKNAGGSLSRAEDIVFNGTSLVESNIQNQAKESASKKLGAQLLFNPAVQIGLVGVVVLVVILIFRR